MTVEDLSFRRRKKINTILIVFLIVYPLLFIWQGLDVTDMGLSLTKAQLFFQDPGLTFTTWLSALIGGLWYSLFGFLGVLGFKIAYVLVIYITVYLTYQILKGFGNKTEILFSLLLTLIFITWWSRNWLNYNWLTSLFLVLSGFLLFNGLCRNSNTLIFLSGITAGLSMFIRFPNLLIIFLFVAIVYYGFFTKQNYKSMFFKTALFISGYALVIILIYAFMQAKGYHNIFNSVTATIVRDPQDVHHSSRLMSLFYKDHLFAISLGAMFCVGICILPLFLLKIRKSWLRNCIILLLSFSGSFVLLQNSLYKYLFPGILFLVLLAYIPKLFKKSPEFRLASLIAILILFVAPLGSGNGILNARFGMWLAFPLVLLVIIQTKSFDVVSIINGERQIKVHISQEYIDIIKKFVVLTILVLSLYKGYSFTYRDTANRLNMRYSVDHPMLRGVFTTKARAEVMQELLDKLPEYVSEGDLLFTFEQIPLVIFLTKTQPYLKTPWPMLSTPSQLEATLEHAIKEHPYLPVYVAAKGSTQKFEWPRGKNQLPEKERYGGNRLIVKKFLKDYDYRMEWENNYFEIWTPSTQLLNQSLN
jgi:hypothetical protein